MKITPTAVAAVLCGSAAVVLCLVALGRVGWRLELGDLGVWVGGIASAAAAGAAYLTLRELLRTRKEQQEEQRARVQRRASRVQVRTVPCDTAGGVPGWSVTLTNRSGHPIYDVRWLGLVAMRPEPPEILTDFICLPTRSEFADYSSFVPDSDTCAVEYIARPADIRESHYPFPRIEFTDDDGYVFRYVVDRLSPSLQLHGRWKLQGPARSENPQEVSLGNVVPPPDIQPS